MTRRSPNRNRQRTKETAMPTTLRKPAEDAPPAATDQVVQNGQPEATAPDGSAAIAEFVAWLTPSPELEEVRRQNAALQEQLDQLAKRLPEGKVVIAPRCGSRSMMTGTTCNALLAVAVGPGTILDCPRCRQRHEW